MQTYEQQIAERAYYLWEAAGRPDGQSERFWLEAEQSQYGPLGQIGDFPFVAWDREIPKTITILPPPAPRTISITLEPREVTQTDGGGSELGGFYWYPLTQTPVVVDPDWPSGQWER